MLSLNNNFSNNYFSKGIVLSCTIGDTEFLLDLDTSMQTAICTQRTEVLVLEMKHYERLLAKRNPRTIDMMMENLEVMTGIV